MSKEKIEGEKLKTCKKKRKVLFVILFFLIVSLIGWNFSYRDTTSNKVSDYYGMTEAQRDAIGREKF